ncbi:MAG: hypothetical protein LBD67_03455 [Candidatus Accumulibacter sp.]|jgi:hypothetical protein|nr:hypothetical protein [Accumulibacter sp.]
MDTKAIQAKLNTIEAWKAMKDKGLFAALFGTKPKQNLDLWQSMEKTDVLPLHDIRRDQHENNHYVIYAFSTKGELSQGELLALSEAASQIPLNAIRYDAMGWPGFGCMRTFQQTLDENDGDHNQISIALTKEENGLFVFIGADFDAAALDAPYVAYGRKGRSVYVYPLSKSKLQMLL